MAVVIDASMAVVLVNDDPRRGAAEKVMEGWMAAEEALHAPVLLTFEFASALTRLAAAGVLPAQRLADAWRILRGLPITYHGLEERGEEIVETALRMQRSSAYDAAYLVLARDLGVPLWTLDGRLARNATTLGFPVNLVSS
jgi:predicted nucleic acid-binding protein